MKKPITQISPPSISYAIFLDGLMRSCADNVKNSMKYAEKIDSFGQALVPFQDELLLCISVHQDSVSLMATVNGDHTPVMLKLIQAGFEIGETVENVHRHTKGNSWKAPVHGADIDFVLYFETTVDASEAL